MNKINIISIILIIVTLLSVTACATETTYRHTGFEVWGWDMNFTKLNATNMGVLGFQQNGVGVPPVSGADKASLYYDSRDRLMYSENGNAYKEAFNNASEIDRGLVAVARGGTGASTSAGARTNLGIQNGSYSYYIYNNSGTYYAVNSAGGVDYSGTNAWDVLNQTVNTSNAKYIYLKSGCNILNAAPSTWNLPANITIQGEDWNIISPPTPASSYIGAGAGTTLIHVSIEDAFAPGIRKIQYFHNGRANTAQAIANYDYLSSQLLVGEPGQDNPGFSMINYGSGDSIYLQAQNNIIDPAGASGAQLRFDDYSTVAGGSIYGGMVMGYDYHDVPATYGERHYLRVVNTTAVKIDISNTGIQSEIYAGTGDSNTCFDSTGHFIRSSSLCVSNSTVINYIVGQDIAPLTSSQTNVYTETLRVKTGSSGIAVGTNTGNASMYISNNPSDPISIYRTILSSGLGGSGNGFACWNATGHLIRNNSLCAIGGVVTSVTGTAPVSSSGGTTPAISMAAASSGVNGYMTGTYATKLDGIATGAQPGTVTSVSGTAPIVSSGGTTPAISIPAATSSVNGYATSTQITKLNGIETGATADQSQAEIVAAIAGQDIAPTTSAQTNVYTETLRVKTGSGGIALGENGGTAIMYFDNTPGQGTISFRGIIPSGNGTLGLGWTGARWADIWGVNIHTGDLAFSENTDYNTGVPFKIGDTVKLIVIGFDEAGGIRTVPVLDNDKCKNN